MPRIVRRRTSASPSSSSDAKLLGTRRKFARARPVGRRDSANCCRTSPTIADDICHRQEHGDRRVQSRPGQAVRQHRLAAVRPAEHGRLGDVRHRQRIAGPARLRRAAIGPARPARRGAAVGQRLPADDLPGRAVPARPRADSRTWPARRGIDRRAAGQFVDAVNDLNRLRLDETGDPEIATRIAAYEMAYRMQIERPGADGPRGRKRRRRWPCTAPSRASRRSPTTACWPAGWSNAACASCSFITPTGTITATPATDLGKSLDDRCREVDQPAAALVKDLKRRGLLDSTLVVWGGEFGRTPMGEPRDTIGRDHHIDGYTMWLAGGGIKAGQTDRPDRRAGLLRRRRPSPRPRPAGDDPAPAGPRPLEADVSASRAATSA